MSARRLPEVARGAWRDATLLAATRRIFPLVNIRLVFRGGSLEDPPGKEGLSMLAARMLERGTRRRKHAEVIDALETLGGTIRTSAGFESLHLEGLVLRRSLDRWLAVIAEMLLEPSFDEEALELCKQEMLAELAVGREEDRDLGDAYFRRAIWGDAAYGRPPEGTGASLPGLGREDVAARWRQAIAGARLIAAAAGDLDLDELGARLDEHLGALPAGSPAPGTSVEPRALRGVEVLLVDKPERTQTQLFLGRPAVPPGHEDYFPFLLANHAFGGMFTSRLMQEVRVKRGWSYGAYSRLEVHPTRSVVAAWTFPANEDTMGTIRLLLDLLGEFAREGVTGEELEAGKGHLRNVLAFEIETPEAQVSRRLHELLLGLPDDWTRRFLDAVGGTSLARANDAARSVLGPDLALTAVCTAGRFVDPLAAMPEVSRIDVVPFDADDPSRRTNVFTR